MTFKAVGGLPFTDLVIMNNGQKLLGECRFDEDLLLFRKSGGWKRFWGSVLSSFVVRGLEIAVQDADEAQSGLSINYNTLLPLGGVETF